MQPQNRPRKKELQHKKTIKQKQLSRQMRHNRAMLAKKLDAAKIYVGFAVKPDPGKYGVIEGCISIKSTVLSYVPVPGKNSPDAATVEKLKFIIGAGFSIKTVLDTYFADYSIDLHANGGMYQESQYITFNNRQHSYIELVLVPTVMLNKVAAQRKEVMINYLDSLPELPGHLCGCWYCEKSNPDHKTIRRGNKIDQNQAVLDINTDPSRVDEF